MLVALWSFPFKLPIANFEMRLVLYMSMAFVLGIIVGGMMKELARLILGVALISGFILLVLLLIHRQDIISLAIYGIFGLVMLALSLLAKVGKSYIPRS